MLILVCRTLAWISTASATASEKLFQGSLNGLTSVLMRSRKELLPVDPGCVDSSTRTVYSSIDVASLYMRSEVARKASSISITASPCLGAGLRESTTHPPLLYTFTH